MKDDYLWDKTGSDAEIEKLESTLASMRYVPTAAPHLPPQQDKVSGNGFWRLRPVLIPAFASVLIGSVVMGTWFAFSSPEHAEVGIEVAETSDARSEPSTIEMSPPDVSKPPGDVRMREGTTPDRVHATRHATKARKFARKEATSTLTKEEKDAYDRLMLALAITSSKLRLVQDKVNGPEIDKTLPDNKEK